MYVLYKKNFKVELYQSKFFLVAWFKSYKFFITLYLLKWGFFDSQNKIRDVLELNMNKKFGAKIVIVLQSKVYKIH